MKKIRFLLCGLLWLVACGGQTEVGYTTYESEALGIVFEYPAAWVLEANELQVNVATDAKLFGTNAANFNDGVVANFSAVPLAVLENSDLATALTEFTSFVTASGGAGDGAEVRLLTINGRSAAQSVIAIADSTKLLVTMIEAEAKVILVVVGFDDSQYEPMVMRMVESVVLQD